MRDLVGDYVHALHATYVDHVSHLPPVERAALPLMATDRLTVIAAAAHRLHLVATTDRLPPVQGPEVSLPGEYGGVSWTVRFFDATVLPALGLLANDQPNEVRRVLGVTDSVYHLTVSVGGGLGTHHAQHSGVALANQHAKVLRDLDRLRHALPQQSGALDELGTCVRCGLDRAAALLVTELTAGRVVATAATPASTSLEALLADVDR